MTDLTRILAAAEAGDPAASAELLPLVYEELRSLAAARLASEPPGHTLQPTALVHEAYVRLVGGAPPDGWGGRAHFFAAAAEAMRRILVEQARRKRRLRRGGALRKQPLDDHEPAIDPPVDGLDLLALSEVLDRLEAAMPRRAHVVKLRYFVGLTLPEISQALGIARSTAAADWTYARAWLQRELKKST